jgi:hypothetical protein
LIFIKLRHINKNFAGEVVTNEAFGVLTPKKRMRKFTLLVWICFGWKLAEAQLVQWDFENVAEALAPLPIAASYRATSMAYGQAGLSVGNNNGTPAICFGENTWATNFWSINPSPADNYYMEFSTGTQPGYVATFTGFSMYVSASSQYSADKFAVYMSSDNFATRTYVGTGDIEEEACAAYIAVLPQAVTIAHGQVFAIRVHPYRQFSRYQVATIRIDNVTLEGTALPIVLSDFDCRESEEGVQLSWETQIEENTDRFEIEHRLDGADFQRIGQVKAAGNSRERRNYSFVHRNPAPGYNYYRLKQLDTNGNYEYFEGQKVAVQRRSPAARSFSLLANISEGNFVVRIHNRLSQTRQLLLFSLQSGARIQVVPVPEESATLRIALGHLPPGMYWLLDPATRHGEKLVVVGQ